MSERLREEYLIDVKFSECRQYTQLESLASAIADGAVRESAGSVQKADGKPLNSPVTQPSAGLHPNEPPLPRRLAVIDDAGAHLFWVDEHLARDLMKAEKVKLIRTRKGRVLGLRAVTGRLPELLTSSPATLVGKRYSHNRETEQNPRGCWELVRINGTHRCLLLTAINECRKVA